MNCEMPERKYPAFLTKPTVAQEYTLQKACLGPYYIDFALNPH